MMRRVRWRRVAVLVSALLAAGVWPVAARTAKEPPEAAPRVVVVEYGDSLWTLAHRYGDPEQDVRSIVGKLLRANDVDPGALQPGEQVVFPAECLAVEQRQAVVGE